MLDQFMTPQFVAETTDGRVRLEHVEDSGRLLTSARAGSISEGVHP